MHADVVFSGNFILMGSTTAIVIGLTFGGNIALWNSVRDIVSIVVEMVGILVFVGYGSLIPEILL